MVVDRRLTGPRSFQVHTVVYQMEQNLLLILRLFFRLALPGIWVESPVSLPVPQGQQPRPGPEGQGQGQGQRWGMAVAGQVQGINV